MLQRHRVAKDTSFTMLPSPTCSHLLQRISTHCLSHKLLKKPSLFHSALASHVLVCAPSYPVSTV